MSTARILELSVPASIGSYKQTERQERIDAMKNPIQRGVSQALLNFAVAKPRAASRTLNALAHLKGLDYLGSGVEFSVYRDRATNSAIKVHRQSAEMPADERQALVQEKEFAHGLLANFMGSTILDQTVTVGEHVLGGYEALLVTQPFVPFEAQSSPFLMDEPEVDVAILEGIVTRYPGADDSFTEFIARSRRMFEKCDQIPDTNGTNNVVAQTDGSLALLDSTPISQVHRGVQQLVVSQLASLERGLLEVV